MPGNRHSIRLSGFDYAAPAVYFITLCTENREPLFGRIVNAEMQLSEAGIIIRDEWLRTPILRPTVHLDEFIVMPNHFHAIVGIGMNPKELETMKDPLSEGAHSCAPCPQGAPCPQKPIGKQDMGDISNGVAIRSRRSLSTLVAQFKATTTRLVRPVLAKDGKVWQRGYDERLIRNAVQLDKRRAYIRNNARNWTE